MGWRTRLATGITVFSLGLAPGVAMAAGPASSDATFSSATPSGPAPSNATPSGPASSNRGMNGLGGVGIGGAFGLAPATGSDGKIEPYFQLAVAPGHAVTATVVVANLAQHAQTLDLGRAVGVTAGNGGSAYLPVTGQCSGPACWVTGLPSRITLPAGDRELVSFTVRVPLRTSPGQYLSGIAAVLATRPAPVKVGSNGASSARAVIVDAVTVGVAVTVGDPSSLVTKLSIRGVQGIDEGAVARLNVSLYNTGQTFAKGTGQASCLAAGRPMSYPVYAGTVLPGGHALIAVNAPGLPEGASVPCTIQVRYGARQVVSWTGSVAIPGGQVTRPIRTGNGAYALPAQSGIPGWAIALIVIGALLLVAVIVLLYRQTRPRHR